MKVLILVGLVVASLIASATAVCKWTGCEGKMILGQAVCNNYKAGWYTGKTNTEGCSWDTSKCYCCYPDPESDRKWTKSCYGTAYSALHVCTKEYGYYPTGKSKACSGFAMTQYECGKA